jgi:predicted nucleotidyltransferase
MVLADEIIRFVNDVADRFSPERIVLFGSYAYGTPTVDSDVDILVIMPYRGPSHHLAARIRLAVSAPFPMDLLVRSSPEIARRIKWNDFFLKEVIEKGLVLHASDDSRVGAQGRRRLRRRLAAPAIPQANPA